MCKNGWIVGSRFLPRMIISSFQSFGTWVMFPLSQHMEENLYFCLLAKRKRCVVPQQLCVAPGRSSSAVLNDKELHLILFLALSLTGGPAPSPAPILSCLPLPGFNKIVPSISPSFLVSISSEVFPPVTHHWDLLMEQERVCSSCWLTPSPWSPQCH